MLQVGKPVTGKQLIGRDNELLKTKELLKAGQSIVIIAPRRMGKTSMVLELLNQLKAEGFYTSFTDVFSVSDIPNLASKITASVLSNRKMDQAFRKALKDISEFFHNIEFKQEVEDFKFILNFKEKMNSSPWDLLEESLDFIDEFAQKHKKQMVMAFDEFGDITKLDGKEIVKLFRSKLQMHQHVSYLFSGSYESVMNELFVGKNAPFFRMARIINLENIGQKEFLNYLRSLFKQEGVSVDSKRLEEVLAFTQGHPYYTQLYAQEMIINIKLSNDAHVPSHDQMLEELLISEKNYLEKLWDEMSGRKETKRILIALANTDKGIYSTLNDREINIPRGLKRLTGIGVLSRKGRVYEFSDPLLKLWLQRSFAS